MGADYVAFRRCGVQRSHDPQGFLDLMKTRAALAIASTLDHRPRTIRISGENNPDRVIDQDSIQLQTEECATCPLSLGSPLGCWQYVTYPVDATFETTLHAYFCQALDDPPSSWSDFHKPDGSTHTAAALLHGLFLSEAERSSVWHAPRPSVFSTLAPPPVRRTRLGPISSADVLHCTFQLIDGELALRLYASYFGHYVETIAHVRPRTSRTVDEVRCVSHLLDACVELLPATPLEVVVAP